MSHNLETLKAVVLLSSEAQTWTEATKEWVLVNVYDEPDGTCICEHHPITEHCVIMNKYNNQTLEVGNVCVQRFEGKLGDEARLAGQAFKRLRKNEGGRANVELLNVAHRALIIKAKEVYFYKTIMHKRILSEKMKAWKVDIEKKILLGMRKPPHCNRCNQPAVPRISKNNRAYFICPRCKEPNGQNRWVDWAN